MATRDKFGTGSGFFGFVEDGNGSTFSLGDETRRNHTTEGDEPL